MHIHVIRSEGEAKFGWNLRLGSRGTMDCRVIN